MGRRALAPPPGGWEKAIWDAIERLKQEKPLNPQLLRQAKLGRLHIGPSTVAREAGCHARLHQPPRLPFSRPVPSD